MNYLNSHTDNYVSYLSEDQYFNQYEEPNQNMNDQVNNCQGQGKVQEINQNASQSFYYSSCSTGTNNLSNQIQYDEQCYENKKFQVNEFNDDGVDFNDCLFTNYNKQCEVQQSQFNGQNQFTLNQNHHFANSLEEKDNEIQNHWETIKPHQWPLNQRNEISFQNQDDDFQNSLFEENYNNQQDYIYSDMNLPINNRQPYDQLYQQQNNQQELIEQQWPESENIELQQTTSFSAQFHPELQNLTIKNEEIYNYQSKIKREKDQQNEFNNAQKSLQNDKIKKKRQRKTKINAIKKPSYSETKNLANYTFKLLFEQVQIYNGDFECPKTAKYINIKLFYSILQTHLNKLTQDEQIKFQKTVLNIIDIILTQKAQNQRDFNAFFVMIKYIPALRIMVQNLGKFSSFKEAQKYALSTALSSSVSQTYSQLFINII